MSMKCLQKRHVMLCLLLQLTFPSVTADLQQGAEVCTNHMILPGPKGDPGEKGNNGESGKIGKEGPKGLKGDTGESGEQGEMGRMGKTGPFGANGDKGINGLPGLPGTRGKPGTTCDCGRYREHVGQLDITISQLKSSVKFAKNVIAGIKETDEKYYLLVKEEKNYRDALKHCKDRNGTLVMPKDAKTNSLIATYISEAGLTRVYIGINDVEKEGHFMFTDNSPLQNYSSWRAGEPNNAYGGEDCVEMVNTGGWNDVECRPTIYFVCEFIKKRKYVLQIFNDNQY
ncbi:collectin-10 [Protopterus annectens]|uniref:collectin-10 n=1 Tax=Protopterus annectens TaxID=7888 RepID=UPI001CFAD9BD|nr:collectin-10 [Protopterus annectens]